MPRITTHRIVFATACVLAVVIGCFWYVTFESAEDRNFKRIAVGMSLEEVEAVLGPGTVMEQAEVMSHPVAVNLDEAAAFVERHRNAGTVPTAREYATRLKPVVEGDVIYYWKSGYYDTWIAFKDGKV